MKRFRLLILIMTGLLLASCTVSDVYTALNEHWGLQLPKAISIIEGQANSSQRISSTTKNLDFIFNYAPEDQTSLDQLTIWTPLSTRDTNFLVKELYSYYYPDDATPQTPAQKLQRVEEKLVHRLDDSLSYYSKRDHETLNGGQIILLYDSVGLSIHAFHIVE